jgi:hypothetical protein
MMINSGIAHIKENRSESVEEKAASFVVVSVNMKSYVLEDFVKKRVRGASAPCKAPTMKIK